MIRIQQLKMPLSHKREDIIKKAAKRCKIKPEQILNLEIVRRFGGCTERKVRSAMFIP